MAENNQTAQIAEFSIEQVFVTGHDQYTVPLYQREYAWGRKEIERLLNDLFLAFMKGDNLNYYLGSFVGDTTVALCVTEQRHTADQLKADASTALTLQPESAELIRRSVTPDAAYLSQMNSADMGGANVDPNETGNGYAEMLPNAGVNLPMRTFGALGYATVVTNKDEIILSVSVPGITFQSSNGGGFKTVGFPSTVKGPMERKFTELKSFLGSAKNPDKLIAVGAAILVAGIAADNVNLWLKQVASRPRYKYLITLDDPKSEFRNWWQMVPNFAGSNDSFKSWPSGNMTIASMMFSLPMLADVTKKRSESRNLRCFAAACVFVLIYGYNRIHMTNHFLSDVCFGTLITYLMYALVSKAFLKAAEKD